MGEVLLIAPNTLPELGDLTLLLLTVSEVTPFFLCDIHVPFHLVNALNCLICRSAPYIPPVCILLTLSSCFPPTWKF